MEVRQCYQEALNLLPKANDEFAGGEILKASHTSWQAAAYTATAAAMHSLLPINEEHESLHNAAHRLAKALGDPQLSTPSSLAQKFLANSWHGFVQDYEVTPDRLTVKICVNRVLSLPELLQAGN